MVDLHSHILWEVDDGSKSREMTLAMLKRAEESGTKVIVATPHYLRDRYEVKHNELSAHFEKLKSLIKDEGLKIEVILGQEVYYSENILELYKNGEIGCIEGTNYMLVELPMREFSVTEVTEVLYELQVKGVNIIIAHPERYKPFLSKHELINTFIKEGYLFQLNAGSITGAFGKETMKLAEKYINNNIYSFIGSDAHREDIRNTDIKEQLLAISKKNGNLVEEFEENGYNLIGNKMINFKGSLIRKDKKGLFGFFKK